MSRYPTYDPKRDGNRFAWILKAAQEVRAERQMQKWMPRFSGKDRKSMAKFDRMVEEREEARIKAIRSQYGKKATTEVSVAQAQQAQQALECTEKTPGL